MARFTGDINPFNLNFEIGKNAPIDARLKCPTYNDLLGTDTPLPFAYKGMIVAVTDDSDSTKNGVYVMIGENIGDAGISTADDWKKIDEVGGSFRFLGTAYDYTDSSGFLVTEPGDTYEFLQGDVFRISGNWATDHVPGLYYVTQDYTFDTSVSDSLIPAGLVNDIESSGDIVLFEPETESSSFRFLGLAFDPVSETGFLYTGAIPNVAYEFLAGDIIRVNRSGYTTGLIDSGNNPNLDTPYVDGLYYFTADQTWPNTITDTEAGASYFNFLIDQGILVLFEPEQDLYLSNLVVSNPTLQTPEDHGGIDAGTTVATLQNGTNTVSDILDMILFPPVCPAPGAPAHTFTDSNDDIVVAGSGQINGSGLHIVGDQINSTFTFTADPGTVVDQGDWAGALTTGSITDPDGVVTDLIADAANHTLNNFTLSNYEVTLGIQTWSTTIKFAAGPDVLDSYGEATCPSFTNTSQNFGTFQRLEGVYPVFAGTSTIYTPGVVSGTWDQAMGPSGNASWSPVALFSFETLSNKQIAQSYGESDNASTWVNHRFAVPNDLGLSSIQVDAGQLGWQDATSSFDVIGGLQLTINGVNVVYTIYERVNSAAGGANNYRLNW